MIESRREIGLLKTYSRKFQKKENKLINKLEKIEIKNKKNNEQKINEIKKKIFDLYQYQNRIYASGFVEYTVRITHSFKDLEKYDQSDLSIVKFVFPLTWCYGTYRTCQHSDLDDVLNKISKKTDDDLVIINDFYETNINYDELLKSASEKKLEKEKLLEQEKEKKCKEKEEQKKAKEKEKDEHE